MFQHFRALAASEGGSGGGSDPGFDPSALWLLLVGALITLGVQFAVEAYRNRASTHRETRDETRLKEREEREEARLIDRELREEARAATIVAREAERARVNDAWKREELACEELDRLFAIAEAAVPDAVLDVLTAETSQLKSSTLGGVVAQAAYLPVDVRERILELHDLLKWADEVSSHRNSAGEHFHHIRTYCRNIVLEAHEILARHLRREPLPPVSDEIIQYRIGQRENFARREDEYRMEGKEYEEEVARWEVAHPEVTRDRTKAQAAYEKYLEGLLAT